MHDWDEHDGLVGPALQAHTPTRRNPFHAKMIWFALGICVGALGLWSMQLAGEVTKVHSAQPTLTAPLKRQPPSTLTSTSSTSTTITTSTTDLSEYDIVLNDAPSPPPPASPSPAGQVPSQSSTSSPTNTASSSPSESQAPLSNSPIPPPPPAAAFDPSLPSPSPSPCSRGACEIGTSQEACHSMCGCVWRPEYNFCYTSYSNKHLIGPYPPRPVPPVWDGTYENTDLPRPLPQGFAGPPLPEAKGKFAYVTMISPWVPNDHRRYCCMGLSLLTSIRKTNPDPNIDFVLVVLLSDDDHRYAGQTVTEEMIPELLGKFYGAFKKVGVNRFVLWRELDTSRTIVSGTWKQAFSKLQMWTLVQYEKIIFMDADKVVFRNIDHLFEIDADFATPGDWNCRNAGAALFPSGGFWVMRPSLKTFKVITDYLAGPDPCGEKWYQGDQMLPRLLFTDITEVAGPTNSLSAVSHGDPVARWDGDVGMMLGRDVNTRIGRCSSYVTYNSHPSHRIDSIVPKDKTQQPHTPLKSSWVMLNMSYDMTVGVCDNIAFSSKDNRFEIGTGGWAKVNPFSVHMSCFDGKPSCRYNPSLMEKAPPCLQEIFSHVYDNLKGYDMDDLLSESDKLGG